MQTLAGAGFQQSYTYFTWRNTKLELGDYLTELSRETSAWLRPNLFVNTPDILTEYLQFGGPPAFKIRAAIAATASPSWGVYSGFELYESVARPGSEEYIDNEKYQYRPRDFAAAEREGRSLAPFLKLLNRIRSEHPALRQLRNLDCALERRRRHPGVQQVPCRPVHPLRHQRRDHRRGERRPAFGARDDGAPGSDRDSDASRTARSR